MDGTAGLSVQAEGERLPRVSADRVLFLLIWVKHDAIASPLGGSPPLRDPPSYPCRNLLGRMPAGYGARTNRCADDRAHDCAFDATGCGGSAIGRA
jgi:hypothetical protein